MFLNRFPAPPMGRASGGCSRPGRLPRYCSHQSHGLGARSQRPDWSAPGSVQCLSVVEIARHCPSRGLEAWFENRFKEACCCRAIQGAYWRRGFHLATRIPPRGLNCRGTQNRRRGSVTSPRRSSPLPSVFLTAPPWKKGACRL